MGNGLFQIRTSRWRENNRIIPQGKEDYLPVFSVAHPQRNLPPKAFKANKVWKICLPESINTTDNNMP